MSNREAIIIPVPNKLHDLVTDFTGATFFATGHHHLSEWLYGEKLALSMHETALAIKLRECAKDVHLEFEIDPDWVAIVLRYYVPFNHTLSIPKKLMADGAVLIPDDAQIPSRMTGSFSVYCTPTICKHGTTIYKIPKDHYHHEFAIRPNGEEVVIQIRKIGGVAHVPRMALIESAFDELAYNVTGFIHSFMWQEADQGA